MEDDWDLFIDLDIELYNKDKDKDKDKNNISDNNYSFPLHWNKVRIKRRFFYFYTVEKCNHQENETDFFKNRQIKEKNKYLDKFNCYKLPVKKV